MHASEDAWGCKPFNDRDWGASEPCVSALLLELTHRLNENCTDAQKIASTATACVSETVAASLNMDFEAASGYREQPDSPSSVSQDDAEIIESEASLRRFQNTSVVFEVPYEQDNGRDITRDDRRRQTSFAKHRRISLFASALNPAESFLRNRKSLFVQNSQTFPSNRLSMLHERAHAFHPSCAFKTNEIRIKESAKESPLNNIEILETIFDFLEENDLLFGTSLVSRKWFDAATRSHANLMLLSVGCGCEQRNVEGTHELIVEHMQRPWNYLTSTFPWACFLSEGAYKRVFKVFNHVHRVEEAVSVM